jgi:hypothetical protein
MLTNAMIAAIWAGRRNTCETPGSGERQPVAEMALLHGASKGRR